MLCVLVAVAGCGPDEKYKALEAERNALQNKLKTASDQDQIMRIRTNALSLMRRICSNSFDPAEDISIVDEVLDNKLSQVRIQAFKDDTATLEDVLRTYRIATKGATAEWQNLSDKLKQQQQAVHAKEGDLRSASKDIDASSFTPTNLMLARKFDDKDGYSVYEAFDFSRSRKVVALVPNEFEVSLPYDLRSFAKPLGDQPFRSTISNNFRSFEQTDYFPVLKVANKIERIAITGGADEMQKLRHEVAQTEAQVTKARLDAQSQVHASMAPMSSDIKRLTDALDCSFAVLPSSGTHQRTRGSPALSSSPAGGKAGTTAVHGELSEQCKRELKNYVISDVGIFTKENELAIEKRCRQNPKQGLCFTSKVREAGGSVSMAEKGNIEEACGL